MMHMSTSPGNFPPLETPLFRQDQHDIKSIKSMTDAHMASLIDSKKSFQGHFILALFYQRYDRG